MASKCLKAVVDKCLKPFLEKYLKVLFDKYPLQFGDLTSDIITLIGIYKYLDSADSNSDVFPFLQKLFPFVHYGGLITCFIKIALNSRQFLSLTCCCCCFTSTKGGLRLKDGLHDYIDKKCDIASKCNWFWHNTVQLVAGIIRFAIQAVNITSKLIVLFSQIWYENTNKYYAGFQICLVIIQTMTEGKKSLDQIMSPCYGKQLTDKGLKKKWRCCPKKTDIIADKNVKYIKGKNKKSNISRRNGNSETTVSPNLQTQTNLMEAEITTNEQQSPISSAYMIIEIKKLLSQIPDEPNGIDLGEQSAGSLIQSAQISTHSPKKKSEEAELPKTEQQSSISSAHAILEIKKILDRVSDDPTQKNRFVNFTEINNQEMRRRSQHVRPNQIVPV
mmetsp:Transcript_46359/g.53724  ORF Transcript_46359/g.53724 Transcript_46359/m.53724 type:complete len:388 (+) Transcript_46359:1-1164(+)